jgi:4-oxalomesaconate tautomerase
VLTAIPTTLMRGGTSRGAYFDARDLPADRATRDAVLLAVMGSPDLRQIDGLGGAHPLTSKVAVIGAGTRADADVDYLFLQVAVDRPDVSDTQNCGNILAGVGPWALEHGYVAARDPATPVRIHMLNTGSVAIAHVSTPEGAVEYTGSARIDGVPGTAAPIPLDFLDVAGSSCGALLPTGRIVDVVDGIEVTCIDNGMPVVLLRARDLGLTGAESPGTLEADAMLKSRVELIRLALGPLMRLGDVSRKTVPKMTLVAPPQGGGALSTRTFIPHRVHEAIGVLGAVSVATACVLPGSVAADVAQGATGPGSHRLDIEHPTGFFTVDIEAEQANGRLEIRRAALLRTARKLMQGQVYIPAQIWRGP